MRLLDSRLKAFLKITEIGTVLGAGRSLGLTQTAVTQRIRALENELAVTLFTRSRKGMRLTSEGQALLQYCRGAVELEGSLFSQLSPTNKMTEVQLTIAGPTSIMNSRVLIAAKAAMKKLAHFNVHLLIDDEANLVDLVRTDRAQLAIVSPSLVPLEMDSKRLQPDRYLLVGTAKWAGRPLRDILASERLIDFYETDKTSLNYLRQFELEDQVKKPRMFVNDNSALIDLFNEGIGYGTLEQHIAKPYLSIRKLIALNRGQVMEDPLALVWYPRKQMPEYFKMITQLLK